MTAEDSYELDVLELGERVAVCLFAEQTGDLYGEVKDRTWSKVLSMYGFMLVAARDAGRDVPACWTPAFDSRGMWRMP